MNDLIETGGFRHYLRFEGIGFNDLYQIAEPPGFDASAYSIEQGKLYARDRKSGGLDKLTFIRNTRLENNGISQIINPQGQVSTYLDYGLDWLLHGLSVKGFEFKAFYVLEQNGVFAPDQALDFSDENLTDGYNYLTCKLIDKDEVMIMKRRMDDVYNALSDKDYKQAPAIPVPTMKCLLTATPLDRYSNWKQLTPRLIAPVGGPGGTIKPFNEARDIEISEINNTLTPYFGEAPTFNAAMDNFVYIRAVNDLSSSRLTVNANIEFHYEQSGGSSSSEAKVELWYGIWTGTGFDLSQEYGKLYEYAITGTATVDQVINQDLVFDLNPILRGYNFSLFWQVRFSSEHLGLTTWNFINSSFNIDTIETAIDSIVDVARWIDFIKRGVAHYSSIPVNAPKMESGGPLYKEAVFNRAMISQNATIFNSTLKDTLGSVEELNFDSELNLSEVFIDHYNSFYENVEIGVLPIIPAESGTWGYDSRYITKALKYSYTKYEQFRTSQGTNKAIHTESEFTILNDSGDGAKEVRNKFVRDPLAIRAITDLEIKSPTTSVSEDDDIYIIQIEDLPPGTKGGFGSYLNMRYIDGKLQILNRDSLGDTGEVVINWLLYGLSIGDTFDITLGQNAGTYTIDSITNSVITLIPVSITPTFSGDAFIKVEYTYTGVNYVSRTDEGFISNPTKFINAGRSIKRNITEWFGELLATMTMYCNLDIPNSYFKSNGTFTSQQTSEANPVVENATILRSSLPDPKVTPKVWNLKTICSLADSKSINDNYLVNRGFIRCVDIANKRVIKVFPKKQKGNFANNEMTLLGAEKYENPYVTISYSSGAIVVNDVEYQLGGNTDWWEITGIGMFQAFDANGMPICNPIIFSKVKVNGNTYPTPSDLITAIQSLI